MSFWEEFDRCNDNKVAENQLIKNWLEYKRKNLFQELRESDRKLNFWSFHPGNPDLEDPREHQPGYVWLLTRWEHVQKALTTLNMKPYARKPVDASKTKNNEYKKVFSFILSKDGADHKLKRKAVENAFEDPKLGQKIHQSVKEAWSNFSGYEDPPNQIIDIYQFARDCALRFTGKFFGIPENFIFSGEENLKRWSNLAYQNFIWKIHGRHFGDPEPDSENALLKISNLVNTLSTHYLSHLEGTLIHRLFTRDETIANDMEKIQNIVGAIQGLIDNVATSATYAFNVIITDEEERKKALNFRYDPTKLEEFIKECHKKDTPSPFLPRRGKLSDIFDDEKGNDQEVNFICAIGAAIEDFPNHKKGGDWDIRMGAGDHQCPGRYIGDKLCTAIIACLLELDSFDVATPLQKKWGWVVTSFRIRSKRKLSFFAVNRKAESIPARPRALSTAHDFTSWTSLVDKTFYSRHLPPRESPSNKDAAEIEKLFKRKRGEFKPGRSSLLFTFFAQWLTDSFLRTKPNKEENTDSNHQIDMCQLYGLTAATTSALRSRERGKLKSQIQLDSCGRKQELMPYLFDENGSVRSEFNPIPYVKAEKHLQIINRAGHPERSRKHYFVSGLEQGNSSIGYAAINTLFLREHNRICELLIQNKEIPADQDERLFQTTRLIVTALELKIVIEEYINHITSDKPHERIFLFDPSYAEKMNWYRENWVSAEFDLLYRWHCLLPDNFKIAGDEFSFNEDRSNNCLLVDNQLLVDHGIETILLDASQVQAGAPSLFNTPEFLFHTERKAIDMANKLNIQPYTSYRKHFGLHPVKDLNDLTKDSCLSEKIASVYGDNIDDLDFIVGLYAEKPKDGKLFGGLMMEMVAYDAFTHALTNPLLSRNVWGSETLTKSGLNIIRDTNSLNDMMKRNAVEGFIGKDLSLSMDYIDRT